MTTPLRILSAICVSLLLTTTIIVAQTARKIGGIETEGLQTLTTETIIATEIATLNKKWNLKSGEIYDQSYAGQFLRKDAGEILSRIAKERQAQGKPFPNLGIQEKPERQTLIVNLIIEIKN